MSLNGQKYDENKAKLRILQLMSYKQLRIYVDISWVINKGSPLPPTPTTHPKKKKNLSLKRILGNFCKTIQYNLECCNLPGKISWYNKIYQSTKFTILGPCFFFGFTQLSLELEAEPTFDSEDSSLLPPCLSSVKKSSSRSSPLANLITCPLGLSSLTYAEHKKNKYIRTQRECFQQKIKIKRRRRK